MKATSSNICEFRSSSGLPDYLTSGLSVLFVGINPGLRSAEVGHHFAGPSNRFWKLLFDAGLIPVPLTYKEDWRLPEFGYGLTNAIGRPTSGTQLLRRQDFLEGRHSLAVKIRTFNPRLVALLGVSMAKILFAPEHPPVDKLSAGNPKKVIEAGMQPFRFAGRPVFVLPNPSGRNAHYSYQQMKDLFLALRFVTQGS